MAQNPPPPPQPPRHVNAERLTAARVMLGIILALGVLGYLAYRGTLLPWLFKGGSPAPEVSMTPDPPPAAVPPPSAAVVPPPRGCRLGVGSCDWAGLHSPHPPCSRGVGACDWGGHQSASASASPRSTGGVGTRDAAAALPSPQPGCHHGAGNCDWGGRQAAPASPRGTGAVGPRIAAGPPSPQRRDWARKPAGRYCENCGEAGPSLGNEDDCMLD
jgi:hypothetical protein